MNSLRFLLTLMLLAVGVRAAAQETEPELEPETGFVRSVSELVVAAEDLQRGWVELTPLTSPEAPTELTRIDDRTPEDSELRLRPKAPPGAALLCTSAPGFAILCEQIYLQGEAWIEVGESLDVEVRFETGLAITGRYLLEGWPISGAKVAVVPTGLEADRPFTMPLGLESETAPAAGGLRREVTSDDDGLFALPPLASGEYFLETLLPSGRVHRSEAFELPAPETARLQTGVGEEQDLVWDLGEIDVADGLVVEFQVTDPLGQPIAGAQVAGRQGQTPNHLVNYQTFADAQGVARLSGFSVEQAVHLSCQAPGYTAFQQEYSLLPVQVSCILDPLAAIYGEVLESGGLPPEGAMVSLERLPEEELTPAIELEASEPSPVPLDAEALDVEGKFLIEDLTPGEYRLQVAAPGFEIEEQTLRLEAGQLLELETIVLQAGRALDGRVLDAETREPIVGAELRAIQPPGAADEITNEDGEFRLITGTGKPLVLSLAAEGYVEQEVTLTLERLTAREPLTFTLERGGWIQALVWNEETGLPCQSCRLLMKPSSQELLTSAAGEALSPALKPGWYRVHRPRVRHLGSTVISEDDAEVRDVRVRRGETSTVRFGERRRSVPVRFQPSPGADWSLSARSIARTERYHPDAAGTFEVRHRSGESLELFLHRFDPESGAEVEVWQATLPAEIPDGEQVLPLAAGQIQARATSSGTPLAGVRVRLRSLDDSIRARARTRADGHILLPHLPAGVYVLAIGERNVQFASLRAGQSLDLGTFDLIPGSF